MASLEEDSIEALCNKINRRATKQIREALEEDDLTKWGFVIYRCTYKSDLKWRNFLSIIQQEAQKCIKFKDVREKLSWTVIEDQQTLDGANVLDASQRFVDWVKEEGLKELEDRQVIDEEDENADGGDGADDNGDEEEYYYDDPAPFPRYKFYIFVDEESVDSVENVQDSGAAAKIKPHFKLTYAEQLVPKNKGNKGDAEMVPITGYDPLISEDEMEELILEFCRNIKITEFVGVYAFLSNIENWERFIPMKTGISNFP